jgi:hypothetical protein
MWCGEPVAPEPRGFPEISETVRYPIDHGATARPPGSGFQSDPAPALAPAIFGGSRVNTRRADHVEDHRHDEQGERYGDDLENHNRFLPRAFSSNMSGEGAG